MGVRLFDRKFGTHLVRELPAEPGVYLFKDDAGQVLYAGKAKDLRQRLAGYRSATRRKVHRKMRALVREASSLEVRPLEGEREALLVENELIRTLRPPYNVDGAFTFLYPALGVGNDEGRTLLAFTSHPDEWATLGLQWYGSFRARRRARDAFTALTALLGRIGHPEPVSRLPRVPRRRGTRLEAFRRLPPDLVADTHAFLAGENRELLDHLFARLLESASARREADEVGEALRTLDAFERDDVRKLRDALAATGRSGFVHQAERDALFIQARYRD